MLQKVEIRILKRFHTVGKLLERKQKAEIKIVEYSTNPENC